MTQTLYRIVLLGLCVGFALTASDAACEGWEDSVSRLSMDAPERWDPMSAGLLRRANAEVIPISGRGHIGGYSLVPANTLIFPYMLIQFIDYDDRETVERPKHQLDIRAKLILIREITQSFKTSTDLPEEIDLATFKRDYASDRARLVSMENDRFDIAGQIPFEDESGMIDYHMHGVIGVNGVAVVTLFGVERFDELGPIIEGPMKTLAFDAGFTYAQLPEAPATPPNTATTNTPPEATGTPGNPTTNPTTPTNQPSGAIGQGTIFEFEDDKPEAAPAAPPPPPEKQSNALFIILASLGLVLVVVIVVVVLVSQNNARAKRTRSRARRHR